MTEASELRLTVASICGFCGPPMALASQHGARRVSPQSPSLVHVPEPHPHSRAPRKLAGDVASRTRAERLRGDASLTQGRRKVRVLIVDDGSAAREGLRHSLEAVGFDVSTLATPIGVRRIVRERAIEVLVLDLHLPLIRGDQLARLVRNTGLEDLPVIIVSASDEESILAYVSDLQNVSVISKSRANKDLAATIESLAGERKSAERLQRVAHTPAPSLAKIRADFFCELTQQIVAMRRSWDRAQRGSPRELERIWSSLHQIKGDSQVLEEHEIAKLVAAISRVVSMCPTSRGPPAAVAHEVRAGLNLLAHVARARESGDANMLGIDHALSRLEEARLTALESGGLREGLGTRARRVLHSLLPPGEADLVDYLDGDEG